MKTSVFKIERGVCDDSIFGSILLQKYKSEQSENSFNVKMGNKIDIQGEAFNLTMFKIKIGMNKEIL